MYPTEGNTGATGVGVRVFLSQSMGLREVIVMICMQMFPEHLT